MQLSNRGIALATTALRIAEANRATRAQGKAAASPKGKKVTPTQKSPKAA